MLTGQEPDETSARVLETYLVLLADHGMNASTFSTRVTASTLGDVYSSIITALGTLKGPLHGGANEAAMKQLLEIGSVENVDAWFEQRVAAGKRLMGFGHRVYKVQDPRATILCKLSAQVAQRSGNTRWHDIAVRLDERVCEHPYFKERRIFANVDFYSALLLYALGIPVDQFTPMFALARVAGWTAHMLEQQRNNRLIRPRAEYVGPKDVPWSEMAGREPQVKAQPDIQCVDGKPANCPAALRNEYALILLSFDAS
jgi:citrate synthase